MGLSYLTRETHLRVLVQRHGVKVSMVYIWLQHICVGSTGVNGDTAQCCCVNFNFSQLHFRCR